MRSFEHMLYTPAPDIVHESAGHAPFIIDIDYSEFLQRFGELGMRAIANKQDMDVYEAVRNLSIIKEITTSSGSDIAAAEKQLNKAVTANKIASESALLTRLHWWTVEYGLVGQLNDYHIFGAGLLSSLGESIHCLNDTKVTKQPLTVDAINTPYDITTEQPQLFVTESCRHLSQILEEFGRHMCCYRGGASALQETINAATINTATTNSGIQISGQFSSMIQDAVGNVIYYNTTGQTQLSYQNRQISGHGIEFHKQGFGSPLGRLRGFERCLSSYTVDELKRHHIELQKPTTLEFLSGITVTGTVKNLIRRQQKNILITLEDCTVTDVDKNILFDPSWGVFDMAIGDSIISVQGGSADQDQYSLYPAPSSKVTVQQDYDDATKTQFDLYQRIRQAREQKTDNTVIISLINEISTLNDVDWLLVYEALELSVIRQLDQKYTQLLFEQLKQIQMNSNNKDEQTLISYGLEQFN